MRGQVVHAKHGQRGQYQAIQSKLCSGSAPLAVLAALMKLYPFQTLYIADLDAILGQGNHDALIQTIRQEYPKLNIWLDNGARMTPRNSAITKPVLGSESIQSLSDYLEKCSQKHVLSLDYNSVGAMGIADLHESAEFWPDEVICMTLNAVGSTQGVDMLRLNEIIRLNLARKVSAKLYAAGGVRDKADLQALANMRLSLTNNQLQMVHSAGTSLAVAGVLLASSLHNGCLSSDDIAHFQARQ
jgi:phosphoribosylformimino-5-aminoimidazole carboxamide ribotide isomerase